MIWIVLYFVVYLYKKIKTNINNKNLSKMETKIYIISAVITAIFMVSSYIKVARNNY